MSLDVDRIGALVAAANGTEGEFDKILEGLSQLATPSARSKVIFDHDELQIRMGMPGQFATLNERLKELESLRISPAPVVAAMFSTAEIDVLVLKYWACPGEQRCMFEPKRELPETVRRRFRDDMVKVADAGYMHPWAMRGRQYWRISSKTETILLEEWGVLEPIKDKDDVVALFSTMMNVV